MKKYIRSGDDLEEVLRGDSAIITLRKAGYTFIQIAQQLGFYDQSGACKRYKAALTRISAPDVDEHRKLENERLDVAVKAIWQRVRTGDLDAIRMLDRLTRTRIMLNGLNRVDNEGSFTTEGKVWIVPATEEQIARARGEELPVAAEVIPDESTIDPPRIEGSNGRTET